jgi:hypothetical protein
MSTVTKRTYAIVPASLVLSIAVGVAIGMWGMRLGRSLYAHQYALSGANMEANLSARSGLVPLEQQSPEAGATYESTESTESAAGNGAETDEEAAARVIIGPIEIGR